MKTKFKVKKQNALINNQFLDIKANISSFQVGKLELLGLVNQVFMPTNRYMTKCDTNNDAHSKAMHLLKTEFP